MLKLASATSGAWLERALANVDEILLDHAHCEKKAASTAVTLLFRYPEREALLAPLSRLAREELEHFELVMQQLHRRGVPMRHQVPGPYGERLFKGVRRNEPDRLLDTLLCAGLIEARSCERMRLLAEHLDDAALRELYRALLVSEAKHHQLYVELATLSTPEAEVRERLGVLAEHEAQVLALVPPLARLHA